MDVLGMWLQTTEASGDSIKLLTIFVGIIAVALLFQGIATAVMAMKGFALLKDVKASFDETKAKALPMIANVTEITHSTQTILKDLAPKIKVLSENAVETSHSVRQTVEKLDVTIRQSADKAAVTFEDANLRTQRQVARVDSMVTSTLAATAELGATVNEGIRVPARKIAALVTQTKHVIDTVLDRAKAMGINIGSIVEAKMHKPPTGPFGSKPGPYVVKDGPVPRRES